jgi:hypothetical protein
VSKNLVDMRIGVRAGNGLVSSVWRLFATKYGDVYFATRSLAGVSKLSFHQSGICRSAFTEKQGKPATLPDRATLKWKRAGAPKAGTRHGVLLATVAFPTSFLSKPKAEGLEEISWIDAAPVGSATYLDLVITMESRDFVDKAFCGNQRRVLSHTALMRNEFLLVAHYHGDWEDSDLQMPGDGKVADLLFSANDPTDTGRPIRLTMFSNPKDGDAIYIRELGGYVVTGDGGN